MQVLSQSSNTSPLFSTFINSTSKPNPTNCGSTDPRIIENTKKDVAYLNLLKTQNVKNAAQEREITATLNFGPSELCSSGQNFWPNMFDSNELCQDADIVGIIYKKGNDLFLSNGKDADISAQRFN